jgi:hypothetical protein
VLGCPRARPVVVSRGGACPNITKTKSTGRVRLVFSGDPAEGAFRRMCAAERQDVALHRIAPSAPPRSGKQASKQSLWHRVRYHYRGNAEGSTLRLTLGCLLADPLGIKLRRVGSGKRLTFGLGEMKLSSEWQHQFVAVRPSRVIANFNLTDVGRISWTSSSRPRMPSCFLALTVRHSCFGYRG